MTDAATISTWTDAFTDLTIRLTPRFARREASGQAAAYLRGLLLLVERKNTWQLAEATGAMSPYGFQRLLRRAAWEADGVRDDLIEYVAEYLGDEEGVLILDESGFVKKGTTSVGVSRQYSGTAGRIENCQIGLFAAYRSCHGHALVDREIYLPKCWTDDEKRCRAAGVPPRRTFATKPAMARQMMTRLLASKLPVKWVTADEVYGNDSAFRRLLEQQGVGFVVAVGCDKRLFWNGRYDRIDAHRKTFPPESWQTISCGEGAKGERLYDWSYTPYGLISERGFQSGLLIRRSLSDPTDHAYYFTHGPAGTLLPELVQVAGSRWAIEECFQQAKGQTGLDQYEVRGWTGWYRHITLSMFAQAFLAVVRRRAESATEETQTLDTQKNERSAS